jgi:CRISPR system Cascade subunit CasA
LNLINDPWIKVLRRSGHYDTIAPWQITSNYESDPVLAIACPRADFNAAIAQLLIGILQTVAAPSNSRGNHIPWLKDKFACPAWDLCNRSLQ